MKPIKLRSILKAYGDISRIFLNPESSHIASRRKKYKHNKRVNYVEGWVEFTSKKVAKRTAGLLNNNIFGGKKRSYYHDDIWNIKYLSGFKWSHLTEQLAYERKVKESKLSAEASQTKRENALYLANVKKAKMITAMEEKNEKKAEKGGGQAVKAPKTFRHFKQRAAVEGKASSGVFNKIFN